MYDATAHVYDDASMDLSYDNNGNTLTKTDSTGTTSYTWDFENRLTSVTLPGSGGTVTFKYDPFGRRIYKSSSSGTSVYAYDSHNLIEETNASGAVGARYSQGLSIDEPLAMLRSSTTSYYQADAIGSVTSLSNGAGTVAQNYTYDSFGNIIATTGSLVNSFRYTGREWDTETSLYYYRARYYDPQAGRFIAEDPIRFKGGANFYRYAGNDPVAANDPLGLKSCIWVGDVDLFTIPSYENKKYGPWVPDRGFNEGGPSRAPFGGGESGAPAGVTNRVGVPWARPVCQYHRDYTYDQIDTTYFMRNYICFEIEPCGGTTVWLESQFGQRRRNLGTQKSAFPEHSDQQVLSLFGDPLSIAKPCQSVGPPNQ